MKTRSDMSGLFRLLSVGLVLALALIPQPVAAQAVTGTLLGTVRDSSGGALPGATVNLLNTGTGFSRSLVSDSGGEFTAPLIPTGTYTVTAELAGFRKVSLSNIHVGVDQKVKADLKLDIGQMTESVTIEAETPLIQTNSSDLGATIANEQIEALPLNGRNFVSLTRTIPGVLRPPPGANIDGAGSLAWRAGSGFSANGHRARDNNYLLDGVDNNETWLQTVVIFPSVDALDEFKMQTSTYSAEFGKSLGGVVNLQIKSGANQVHGNAFEFYRNDALDANNFFNNRAGRAKPAYRQDQFGGTLGGPLVKDRTFFFVDYQGLRIKQGQTYVSTVPSALMRAGNFSEINRVIYDPLNPGTPFPGNIIPANRFDPASRNVISQLYPEPNSAGSRSASGQTINNYVINPELERQDNQFDVKLDHNVSANNRAFVRYSFQKTHRFLPATLPHGDAGATFGAGEGNIKGQGLAFNDTHSFSNNLLNEFRFGWNSIKFFMTPIDYLTNPAQAAGIPGINLNDSTSGMTQLIFDNIRNLGANSNQPLITNQNDFQVFNSLTKVSGKHTMKAGGSITWRSREILNADTIVGNFRFNSNLTSNCAGIPSGCTLNTSTGFDVASFLLGYAANKTRNLFDAETYTEKRPEYALYVQDDWRASSKLTLNLGLRWDLFVPWVEKDDRQSNFDPATGRFVVASPDAVINGVNVGRYLQTYSKKDFGPRFGFAYDLTGDGKTVVRGGVGIFWNFTPGGTSSSKAQNPPFLQSTALSTTFAPTLRVQDGLPAPPGVDPTRPAAGSTRSAFDSNFRDGHSTNFNLNIQRQLGRNYMLEVAYVGSRGRDMLTKTNPNQAPPVLGVTNADVNRPFARLSPALRDVGLVSSTGFLNYDGLLVKFQRRYANGFSFMNSYTYGQAIDLNSDNDGGVTLTNVYDYGYNRGPADYDVKHTFVSNVVYGLPFAKENKIVGGWQVAGILYARTGRALTITQAQGVLSTGSNTGQQSANRPNRLLDDIYNSDKTIDHWFNGKVCPPGVVEGCAFQSPADTTATFGDAGRNIARGPGYFNIDVNLVKHTRFGKFEHELRVEVFNLLNHPAFADPNTTFGSTAFGTITAMLANPSCALCGTTERQIQLSMKLRF